MALPYKRSRRIQIFWGFTLLFVFFGFRDLPILNDTAHYYGHYYEMLSYLHPGDIFKNDPYERFEYGYQVLERLLATYVSRNPYTIIMFSSFVFTLCNVMLFKKYTQRVILTLFLFFITLAQYSAIRESFAIMVFYLAFESLLKKKYLNYYILVGVAYLFHRSALVLLVFPLLCGLRVTRMNVFMVIMGSIALGTMIFPLLQMVGMSDNIYFETASNRSTLPIGQFINTIFYGLMAFSSYKIWKRTPNVVIPKEFVWASVLVIGLSIVAIPFGIISRYTSYFIPYLYIMFVFYIEHSMGYVMEMGNGGYSASKDVSYYYISQYAMRWLVMFIILNILRFVIINTFKNEWSHLIPYSFFDFAPGLHEYILGY